MKKHLAIVSFVLVCLLAVGAVSANDNSNFTDDAIPLEISDESQQPAIEESDDGAFNNSEILSADEPSVDVEDVTVNEGRIVYIPFDVSPSDSLSGDVNVTIIGEGGSITNHIKISNETGQVNFTFADFTGLVNAKGWNVSEFYNMMLSSSNFTNANASKIADGLRDIYAASSIDTTKLEHGANIMINATHVDSDRLIDGLNDILNGSQINASGLMEGLAQIANGIHINASYYSNLTDILSVIAGGFDFDGHKLKNNILDSIIVTKASFISAVRDILNELDGSSSHGSVSDIVERLNLKLSTKNTVDITMLMLKKEFTLLEVANIAEEIWNYNHLTKESFLDRLSDATDGFAFNISDIIDQFEGAASGKSNLPGAVDRLISSMRLDENKFVSSLENAISTATFNSPKVADELAVITGIDSSKILKVLEGTSDIVNGFKLNVADVISAMRYVAAGIPSDSSLIFNDLTAAVSFDSDLFASDFDSILAEFNLTGEDVALKVRGLFESLNMTVPDSLDERISDSLKSDRLNFTEFGNAFVDILKHNNVGRIVDMFSVSSNGSNVLISKIMHGLSNHTFDISKTVKTLSLIMRYVNVDYSKILASLDSAKTGFNRTQAVNGLSRMIAGVEVNVSKVMSGLDRIIHEVNLTKSDADAIISNVKRNIDINASKIAAGLDMVVDSISFDMLSVDKGLSKVISAFRFDRASVYDGWMEIADAIHFNDSMVSQGVYKLACGLGIDVSQFTTKFFDKFGYVATFQKRISPGTYDVTVTYSGNGNASKTAKLTVIPRMETPISLNVAVDGHHVYINGNVNPDAKGMVLLEIGDYDVYTLVDDGKFAFDDTLKAGTYTLRAIYSGDLKYGQNNTKMQFTVKSQTQIVSSDVKVTYANSKNIIFTLTDEDGNAVPNRSVTVKLNGKSYARTTNDKGQVSITVPSNLKPNSYVASAAFNGDGNYVKSSASLKVVVSKAAPKLTAKAKTFKASAKTKKYTVTLKTNKNKVMKNTKVTVKIKGKTYTAKTNSKGVATFNIAKLTKKGTFKATVTYAGNAYYSKVTKSVNIKCR